MKNKNWIKFVSVLCALPLCLSGCGSKQEESEALLDAFLDNAVPAYFNDDERVLMFEQLPMYEEDWAAYSVGERIDLDNDGEREQIMEGPYGGLYLDARDQKVYVFAEGEGTAGVLSYTEYEDAVWIVHRDTTHMGRQMYWLTRYNGEGEIEDEFQLSAEYWDSQNGQYLCKNMKPLKQRLLALEGHFDGIWSRIIMHRRI